MGKGLQKLHFTFREEGLTFLAGFPIIYQFAKSLNLLRFYQTYIHLSHRNTKFHWADLILAHFYYTIAGIERLNQLTHLKYNGLIPEITGLPKLPNTRAMRDFLHGISPADLIQIARVHDIIIQRMFLYPKELTTIILDFDSSVLTVYGNQELAEVGYNPHKHGRRSYHPIFVFESHLRISLNGELRSGKATDKSEVIPFIAATLKKLPSSIAESRVRLRLDAGFYCWETVNFIDENEYGFVMVAKATKPIEKILPALKYRVFNHKEKMAISEFRYQPHGWKKPYRFVIMRYNLPPEPETSQRMLLTINRYEYHVFITNLDLEPEHVWYFYNGRAAAELYIKELKADFFMSKIPTRKFMANQTHLQLLLLDYNLFRWFQILCLPEHFQTKSLKWFRQNILVAPGRFLTPGHRNTLGFPKGFTNKELLKKLFSNAKRVRSLLK